VVRFAWTPELVTGDAGIDRQHREILARASALAAALERSAGEAEAVAALGALAEYVYVHFEAEAKLMAASAFPGAGAHAEAHERLCLDFLRVAEAYRAAGPTPEVVALVAVFVEDAIVPHVRGLDQALALHLLARREDRRPAAPRPSAEAVRAALAGAQAGLDALAEPACLLDADRRILHCNPAWDRFAAENGGAPSALGGGLRGFDYLSCLRGDALVRQLDGVLRRVLAGVAQEVSATCHGPVLAHLLSARYAPVATAGGEVVGVTAVFRSRHVLPVADLYRPMPADDAAYLGRRGRMEACAGCGRFRRMDRAETTWDFVPAYVGPAARSADYALCDACFAEQFALTRG
jgi:hemerythrin